MISFPNAKINAGLSILSKRPDGYHNLASIFLPVSWCDALEIIPSETGKDKLTVTGNYGISDQNNLVTRALDIVRQRYDIPPLDMYLHKDIPAGSGLGGGSSDAAFTIKALNEIFHLGITTAGLVELALEAGSDCGFFIHNHPALVTGRGEHIQPLKLNIHEYKVLIITPSERISTKEAFASLKDYRDPPDLRMIEEMDIAEWKYTLSNDFEDFVISRYPGIRLILEMLTEMGSVFTSVSGSGSSVYGIFREIQTMPPALEIMDHRWCNILQ